MNPADLGARPTPRPFGIASDWIVNDAALLAQVDDAELAAAEGEGTDCFGLSCR